MVGFCAGLLAVARRPEPDSSMPIIQMRDQGPRLPEAQTATQGTGLKPRWSQPLLLTPQTQPCSDVSCPPTWLGQGEVAGYSPGLPQPRRADFSHTRGYKGTAHTEPRMMGPLSSGQNADNGLWIRYKFQLPQPKLLYFNKTPPSNWSENLRRKTCFKTTPKGPWLA